MGGRKITAVVWLGRTLLLVGVAAASACTATFWQSYVDAKPAPLTKGLPDETVAMSPAFDARVKARFPPGTPLAGMGLELAREGFVREDWSDLPQSLHVARRHDGNNIACDFVALVFWKSDDHDRLTEIKGEYDATCL